MDTYKLKAWLALAALCAGSLIISAVLPASVSLSPLIIAVAIGAIIGNFTQNLAESIKQSGAVAVATKQILRLGIIFFGFRITLADIASIGILGVVFAFFIVFSAFGVGLAVAKALKIDRSSAILIGSGSAVCGAAAVMATESVVHGGADRVAVALCTVVVFGTVGMFVYPLVLPLLWLSPAQMGFLVGGSLHEVAHVVAASAAIDPVTQNTAVIIKMLRVVMLVPLLLLVSVLNLREIGGLNAVNLRASMPWFALWFLAMIGVGSLPFFPRELTPVLNFTSTALLTLAMGALGLGIRKEVLKNAGKKPFLVAIAMFAWLFVASIIWAKIFI